MFKALLEKFFNLANLILSTVTGDDWCKTITIESDPPHTEWRQLSSEPPGTMSREILGKATLFHRHCDVPMKKVFTLTKYPNGKIRKELITKEWLCQHCQRRKHWAPDY